MKHLESLLQNFCSRRGFGPSSRRRGSLLCFKVIVAKKMLDFLHGAEVLLKTLGSLLEKFLQQTWFWTSLKK